MEYERKKNVLCDLMNVGKEKMWGKAQDDKKKNNLLC